MRALVWDGPREIRVANVPDPEPGDTDVVVRVHRVGISGSELSFYLGQGAPFEPHAIMGHEFSGTVERMGASVDQMRVGDTVAVNPVLSCGACRNCRSGLENLCPDRIFVGLHQAGGFAEFVSVPSTACTPVLDFEQKEWAHLAEPLAGAIRSVEKVRPETLSSLLVQGCGAVGLFSIAVAKRWGVPVILATDLNEGRLLTARQWGASRALNPQFEDLASAVQASYGGGMDAVIDCVGSSDARRDALQNVRSGGQIVLVGLSEAETQLDVNDMVRREVEVTGSFAYSRADFTRALDLIADGFFRPGPWLEERPFESAQDAFDDLLANRIPAARVVLVL